METLDLMSMWIVNDGEGPNGWIEAGEWRIHHKCRSWVITK